jgi:release factor glutamine methyltransferase
VTRGSSATGGRAVSAESIGAVLIRDGGRLAAAASLDPDEGYREAQGLLAHTMGCSRARVAAANRDLVPADVRPAYDALVERRVRGEPYAYIVGRSGFYGFDFLVAPAVLIPRPETERLVEAALERLPEKGGAQVLDLGTGSGVVAVTLARLRPGWRITAVDISADALAVARDNAARLGAVDVRFVQSDWYRALAGERFDLIVSNPPYVATSDRHLAAADLRFEPRCALDGGEDGLDCIRHIVRNAASHLNPDAWLLLEHGYDQAARCRELLAAGGLTRLFCLSDLAGTERVSGGRAHSHRFADVADCRNRPFPL